MSKLLPIVTLIAVIGAAPQALAADLLAQTPGAGFVCGRCPCPSVTYVHHRELRSTYGLTFDPRNFDETEPHYYFGPMRIYARYSG
jgi:hypothetical protein